MTRVLIVDDDAAVRSIIARDLLRQGYDVLVAESAGEAFGHLREQKVDVLLTDLRMSAEADGIDVLAECRRVSEGTSSVLMSAYASARDYKRAMELGAVTVLCKPFTPSELVSAIRQATECATGFHGSVHGLSLVDILQVLHYGRRDVTVEVSGVHPATIHMQGGEIRHAEKASRTGEEALREILATSSGTVSTTALIDGVPHTISRSFESLLLESMRLLDEATRDGTLDLEGFASMRPPTTSAPVESEPGADLAPPSLATRAAAVWQPMAAMLGRPLANAVVVAFDDREAFALSGTGEPEPYAAAARALAHATRRLEQGDVVIECTHDGVGIGVVASERGSLGFAVFDVLPTGSAATWFRSHVSAMARYVLGDANR